MSEEVFPGQQTAPGRGSNFSEAVADARRRASELFKRDVQRVHVIYHELAESSPETHYVIVRIPQF
jgi:hypothetical protein